MCFVFDPSTNHISIQLKKKKYKDFNFLFYKNKVFLFVLGLLDINTRVNTLNRLYLYQIVRIL